MVIGEISKQHIEWIAKYFLYLRTHTDPSETGSIFSCKYIPNICCIHGPSLSTHYTCSTQCLWHLLHYHISSFMAIWIKKKCNGDEQRKTGKKMSIDKKMKKRRCAILRISSNIVHCMKLMRIVSFDYFDCSSSFGMNVRDQNRISNWQMKVRYVFFTFLQCTPIHGNSSLLSEGH